MRKLHEVKVIQRHADWQDVLNTEAMDFCTYNFLMNYCDE